MRGEDFVSISNLLGRYGHIMDKGSRGIGDWEDLAAVFTPDAVFDMRQVSGPEAQGCAAIIAVMRAGRHPSTHHFTNLVIEEEGPDHAVCVSKIITIETDGRANSGEYQDHVVRTADGWRIARRAATVHFAGRSA